MIKLIVLEDNKPVFNPEVRMFAPFRKIIERDKGSKGDNDGRKKYNATKELAFIYWYADPRSNYKEAYKEESKRVKRLKELLDLPEDWQIDDTIQKAIDFYLEEIKDDFDVGFLEDAISAAEKTREYFRSVNYDEMITVGRSVTFKYKIKEVTSSLKDIPTLIENLRSARKKVYSSEKLNTKIRGGGEIAAFELPEGDD